ncbi:MAG: UDP-N-acetylmuramate dehydrogenase [Acidobacteriaceae bacterium]|nr:UDP-N-acetylmuramate dehydrogenase [Acidobacteriaceae bacterium]
MAVMPAAVNRLCAIPELTVLVNVPLSDHTRFRIGGPAAVLCDAPDESALTQARRTVQELKLPNVVIGGGTNLIVSDFGFDGVVLRYKGSRLERKGMLLQVEAGAVLQDVVDESIRLGMKGLETMTGIPGYVGGAIYGNAGAYGRSINELVECVRATDGRHVKAFRNSECDFQYRESIFKTRKEWVILSLDLRFESGDPGDLANTAREIRTIRDLKYPPQMKCAGSIFKNVFFDDLPEHVQAEVPGTVVRDGKVPSAWFLEQAGAKGIRRGDIQVASYHANLVYNDGAGEAADLVAIIQELKQRVRDRFGFELEEEVQYVGFEHAPALV